MPPVAVGCFLAIVQGLAATVPVSDGLSAAEQACVCDARQESDGAALLAVSRTRASTWEQVLLPPERSNLSNENLSLAADEKPRGSKKRKKPRNKDEDETSKESEEAREHEGDHPLNPLRKGQRESESDDVFAKMTSSPEKFVGSFFVGSFVSALVCLCWLQRAGNKSRDLSSPSLNEAAQDEDLEICANWTLDEDAYGIAIAIIIRDTATIGGGGDSQYYALRYCRVIFHLLLVLIMMGFQWFLLLQVCRFITPGAVEQIRKIYTEFEWQMTGANITHIRRTATNLWVGTDGWYVASRFWTLPDELKKSVCHIPLSQPLFLVAVLFIWSLTCFNDIRKASDWLYCLVLRMPNAATLGDVFAQNDTEGPPHPQCVKVVKALTVRLKVFLTIFIILPRFAVVGSLLWIGCRWLVATIDFGDLLMNAVALEFILLLKDLMYMALVPSRNRRDLMTTEFEPKEAQQRPSVSAFLYAFSWALCGLAFALSYTFYMQRVLVGYRWDVRLVCARWLNDNLRDAA